MIVQLVNVKLPRRSVAAGGVVLDSFTDLWGCNAQVAPSAWCDFKIGEITMSSYILLISR